MIRPMLFKWTRQLEQSGQQLRNTSSVSTEQEGRTPNKVNNALGLLMNEYTVKSLMAEWLEQASQ